MKTNEPEMERTRSVHMEHLDGFRFRVELGEGMAPIVADEPPPLGGGTGPDAARLLAAAIGNCLSASLLLCLEKSRLAVRSLKTGVTLSIERNEQGRLRVSHGAVRISVDVDGEPAKVARCAGMFEDYCIVTATVRRAFPVTVQVAGMDGNVIYTSGGEGV